jgi:hypothetical protein
MIVNLKEGKPTFTMNPLDVVRPQWQGPEALSPDKHTIKRRAIWAWRHGYTIGPR